MGDFDLRNNTIVFDEDSKLWILAIFNCVVDEDRIVVDADTLKPMKDNMGVVVRLDTFAGIYNKGDEIGFITTDLYSLIQCLDDVAIHNEDKLKDDE